METKLKIAVLMGGPSSEHEISLKTGKEVIKALDRKKYVVKPIMITKKGDWPVNFTALKRNFDLIFIAIHGEYGEDGAVQKILERHKIFYTGSDSLASRLGIDKIKSAARFNKIGLKTPRLNSKTFPAVVKPVDRGSSVGVSLVRSAEELKPAFSLAKKYSKKIMRQEFISGREVTCGVLEINGRLKVLPPTEIIPQNSRFFDYQAKYQKGASKEITPPNLPAKIIKKIQLIALKAHRAIGAQGFSRTDMIVQNSRSKILNSRIYVLEINTIPGMTETSLLPQQAKAASIGFSELLDIIITAAWKRKLAAIKK